MNSLGSGEFSIKIINYSNDFQKYEIVKLLIIMKILNKIKNRSWIKFYTEFQLGNELNPGIYFENVKAKEAIAYEIKQVYTKEWLVKKTKQYVDYKVPFMNSLIFIPVNLSLLSDNLAELNKELDEYVH